MKYDPLCYLSWSHPLCPPREREWLKWPTALKLTYLMYTFLHSRACEDVPSERHYIIGSPVHDNEAWQSLLLQESCVWVLCNDFIYLAYSTPLPRVYLSVWMTWRDTVYSLLLNRRSSHIPHSWPIKQWNCWTHSLDAHARAETLFRLDTFVS